MPPCFDPSQPHGSRRTAGRDSKGTTEGRSFNTGGLILSIDLEWYVLVYTDINILIYTSIHADLIVWVYTGMERNAVV